MTSKKQPAQNEERVPRAEPMVNKYPKADESERPLRGMDESGTEGTSRPEGVEGTHSRPPGERPTPDLFDETEERE